MRQALKTQTSCGWGTPVVNGPVWMPNLADLHEIPSTLFSRGKNFSARCQISPVHVGFSKEITSTHLQIEISSLRSSKKRMSQVVSRGNRRRRLSGAATAPGAQIPEWRRRGGEAPVPFWQWKWRSYYLVIFKTRTIIILFFIHFI